jgi:hypothetical protein
MAIPRPIPVLAPVTSAVLSLSFRSIRAPFGDGGDADHPFCFLKYTNVYTIEADHWQDLPVANRNRAGVDCPYRLAQAIPVFPLPIWSIDAPGVLAYIRRY